MEQTESANAGSLDPVVRCPRCGNVIDPDVCWCGDWMKNHGYYDNHNPVPMGCDCGRMKAEDVPPFTPNDPHERTGAKTKTL